MWRQSWIFSIINHDFITLKYLKYFVKYMFYLHSYCMKVLFYLKKSKYIINNNNTSNNTKQINYDAKTTM